MATVRAAFPFIEVFIDTSRSPRSRSERPASSPSWARQVGPEPRRSTSRSSSTPSPMPRRSSPRSPQGRSPPTRSSNRCGWRSCRTRDRRRSTASSSPTTNFDAGLAALEAADDVTFVSLANVTDKASLSKLKAHAENMSAAGQKRIAVMMVDPAIAKSPTYADTVHDGLTSAPSQRAASAAW